MSDASKIEWTDATWNPVRGCSRVSEGCRNCYAERVAARFSGPGQPYEGLVRVRSQVSGLTYESGRGAAGSYTEPRWNGTVRMVAEHLADPLRWKRPRRVFVNSMSDLFHESLTDDQIAAVFGVMVLAAQHTYQVLTKRAKRMREFFARVSLADCLEAAAAHRVPGPQRHNWPPRQDWHDIERWPVPWIWLGVSVENQAAADERIPELLATPAAVRWISAEPLIGPVDLNAKCPPFYAPHLRSDRISWIVAGCESGPGARPCDVAWLRSLRDQCAAAGVDYFLKQSMIGPGFTVGDGTKKKAGGVIGLPYLDGVQHAALPNTAAADAAEETTR